MSFRNSHYQSEISSNFIYNFTVKKQNANQRYQIRFVPRLNVFQFMLFKYASLGHSFVS